VAVSLRARLARGGRRWPNIGRVITLDPMPAEALAHAFSSLEGHDGPLVPFVIVESGAGRKLTRLVTSDSGQALRQARLHVRGSAAGATAYCLVVEAYVRLGEDRSDAFVLEVGRREEPRAQRYAQPFRRVPGGTAQPVGELLATQSLPSALDPLDPFSLAWGPHITPDITSRDQVAILLVAHELESPANIDRTIRFIRARIRHQARHLPPTLRQGVHVEDRGQEVTPAVRDRLRAAFAGTVEFVNFTTETMRR